MTEAQKRAKRNYLSKVKRLTINFSLSDQDLVDWISAQNGKQSYIKNLIREDMEKRRE